MKLINLFKRMSFAALGLSAMLAVSCEPAQQPVKDAVSVNPASVELDCLEQQTEITVTSSGDWTLTGEYAWITPSAVSGKNADKVTFSVSANLTGKNRTASFTFRVGSEEAKAVIRQTAKDVDVKLGLTAVSSDEESVTLKLNVESKDMSSFNKWGVRYSFADDKKDGTDFEIEGVPAAGEKEVKVTGLEKGKKYYFWGYVEDVAAERYYTDKAVEATTASANPGDGGETGGVNAPAAYTDMRNKGIAITWADPEAVNNLAAITMETMFRWDDFNPDEGIDTMFGVEGSWLVRCVNNFEYQNEDGWYMCTPYGSIPFAAFERDGSKNVTDWKGMTQDVWHHLAITYDSSTGYSVVYIDGSIVMDGENNLGPVSLYNPSLSDPTFHIGRSYNGRRWFNGDMAEVRIWNRALTSDEINASGHFYGVEPTSDGLIAYWKLDGTDEHVQDYSGNGHHGEVVVGEKPVEPDPEAGGIDAPEKYADMRRNSVAITWSDTEAVNNLPALTIETLFNWDAFNPDEGIDTMLGVEGSWLIRCMNNFHWIPEDGWFVCTPYGSLCFAPFERDGSKNVTNWRGMTQDVWHHLAVTYDSATGSVAIYIDGEAVASGTYQFGPVNLYDASLADPVFHIGKSYNAKRWFNGHMAEVRLWNRALSADEINAEGHFYGVDAASEGLIAYWKLDGTGTHVEDYSGNGHHGTAEKEF